MTLPDPDSAVLSIADFPTPEGAARQADLPGFDHVLGDGRAWRLPNFIPARERVWDDLHDQGSLYGEFEWGDVHLAVAKLLLANYDLSVDFVAWLVARAEPKVLGEAVNWALYGRPDELRGYSDWVESSLLVNGLDPRSVPPPILRQVLHQLVATGRAVPVEEFTTAGRAAARRKALHGAMAESQRVAHETKRSPSAGISAPQTFARPTP